MRPSPIASDVAARLFSLITVRRSIFCPSRSANFSPVGMMTLSKMTPPSMAVRKSIHCAQRRLARSRCHKPAVVRRQPSAYTIAMIETMIS